jgi:hypothetical protein
MPARRVRPGSTVPFLLTGLLLLAGVLAAAGCGGGRAAGNPEERGIVDPASARGITALKCGQPLRVPAGGGLLTLTGRFPAAAPAGAGVVSGAVEVTSRAPVRGVVLPQAEVFLVRDGRVATLPVLQDAMGVRLELARGRTGRLPGEATLVSCEPGAGPVPPGIYELYARVVLTPDDEASVESFGGPWPLQVR